MSGVFLSYSRADRELAEQVVNGLRRIGVEVWWDQDMPGVEWQQELEREINTLAAVVVVWTQNSANSNYVRDEARLALHGGKLVNALAGVHSPPFPYDRVNGLPLDGWNGHEPHNGWSRLVGTVANLVVKAGGAQEGEIQAALAKSEQDVRDKQAARDQAQDAFQEAQAHETDAGEVAKVAREAYERAEEQLQRVGEMRASATILGAAQRELETTRTTRDEADAAYRAAKAALSTASRALTRSKADLDSLLGTTSDPVKPPRAKAAPRKPKVDAAAAAAPATDAPAADPAASDPAIAEVAAAAAAGAAADEIALTEPPASAPPPASPPPPPPPPPPAAASPPPPAYQPYAPTPKTRTPLTSGERTLIAVGIIGGVLVLLVVIIVLVMMASNIHKPTDNTVVDTNTAVTDTNAMTPANATTVAGGTADASNSAPPSNPGAALAPASSGSQPSASFGVTACNRSSDVIGVAVSYLPVGEPTYWKYVGFYTLQPNSCQKMFTTDNETFYMRAESANNSWGDGISLCIIHPGPYDFSIKSGDSCPAGGEPASYSPVTNTSGQDFTWDFNP